MAMQLMITSPEVLAPTAVTAAVGKIRPVRVRRGLVFLELGNTLGVRRNV